MVRISRIMMQGFKSFASKTIVPTPGGIIVITGPNGSGKSNVVDSFTFVLGVTSARHIRAQKLQNLIFKGSRKHKASEYCEVLLELDNAGKEIPGYGDEVRVMRRITRSGISVFKVDGKTVNKGKVLEILSYAGLSPEGHNIVMQGDITRIIEMNPIERRQIIDEISGIEEFNIKKDEAMHHLDKVETRVKEALVIVTEKEKRAEQLKREKEAAETYVELNKSLRKAMASSLKKRHMDAEKKLEQLDEEEKQIKNDLKEAEKNLKELDAQHEAADKNFREINDKILEARDVETIRQVERLKGEIARKKDKIDMLESQLKQTSLREPDLHLPVDATRFSTVLKIPSRYSTAFDVAVGSHSRDLIVETADDAVKGIIYLRQRRLGRVRFLPLNKMRPRVRRELPGDERKKESQGFIGWALDLISYDQKWYPAVSNILGNVVVFDEIKNAKRLAGTGLKAVTLEGDLVEPSGAMVGGWRRQTAVSNENAIHEVILGLSTEIERFEKELKELESKEKKSVEVSGEMLKKREELMASVTGMRTNRNEAANARYGLQTRLVKIETERGRYQEELKDLKERSREFADVAEFIDAPLESLQRTVGEITQRIRLLGPINMRALEDYKTVSVEYEEMKQRLEKLLEEKQSVLKTIDEVESRRKEKFLATLVDINKGFVQTYKDLMDGEAEVHLEEENDIDSGLIIEAQPHGKGKIELDSMSGGERTMTALSFIFAIMQHYACPIYILDEVDAALDKVNAQKVASLLRKYSKKVQFLVITHNDITTTVADKLYGTVMEDGITKIFGISLPSK